MPRCIPIIDAKQSLLECSEFSGPISSTLHNNKNIEAEFCDFYAIILQKLHQKFQTEYELIRKALRCIRTYRELNKPPRLPVYDKNDARLAYVYSFSLIHSVLMYYRFRAMMKKNPSMLKNIFSKSELNICLLGGGPGFEAAAICKFLKKALEIFKPGAGSQLLLVHVTVVDMCAEWETVVECLFTTLQKDLHPLIKVDFCFLHADLAEELSPAVVQKIESSYILVMFKFVNEVLDRYGPGKVEKMMQGIVEVMSPESCLFFLDNAGGGCFRIFEEIINNTPGTKTFYGPKLHHCQELNEDTVEKYSFFVQDIFQTLKCTGKTTVSCSAWLKIHHLEQEIDNSPIPEYTVVKKKKKKAKNSCKEEGNVQQDINSSIQKCTDEKNNEKKKKKGMNSCKEESNGKQDINSSIQKSTVAKNEKKKKKVMNSCKEVDNGKQDINSSIQKSTDVKNIEKKKEKVMNSCKGEGSGEQNINNAIQNCTGVKNNQKKEEEQVMNSCKENGSVEQDISSSIQKSADEKNIEKKEQKVMDSCKGEGSGEQDINKPIQNCADLKNNKKKAMKCKEKSSVEHFVKRYNRKKGNAEPDMNSLSISQNTEIKNNQKKEKKKTKEEHRGVRCISLNQRLEDIESRFLILRSPISSYF